MARQLCKPWLIQRGRFMRNQSRSGIDSVIEFDYMGSAEFEFGELYKSLKRMRSEVELYSFGIFYIKGKSIAYLTKYALSETMDYLLALAHNDFRLKEYSDFDTFIRPSEYRKNRTDFWWDIENDIMWWKDGEMSAEIVAAIGLGKKSLTNE